MKRSPVARIDSKRAEQLLETQREGLAHASRMPHQVLALEGWNIVPRRPDLDRALIAVGRPFAMVRRRADSGVIVCQVTSTNDLEQLNRKPSAATGALRAGAVA